MIRTFVRSGVTKTAFGAFLAAFAFAITGIALDDVDDPATAARTITAAVVILARGGRTLFIVYVTATMKLLEVGWVVTSVADEARKALRHGYPGGPFSLCVRLRRRR